MSMSAMHVLIDFVCVVLGRKKINDVTALVKPCVLGAAIHVSVAPTDILGQNNFKMLEQMAEDYAAYFKVDVLTGFRTVQDVVDNMLTRLEELTSVLQMIKLKDSDCSSALSEDIIKYRSEITTLSKKITILCNVIAKLQSNVDILEKQVEKAETDFGIGNENKLRSLFKPFLRKKDNLPPSHPRHYEKQYFESVMNSFVNSSS